MRFFYHLVRGWLENKNQDIAKRGLAAFRTQVLKTRAGIFDIDVNMHLNNASLILACEFARWRYIASTPLLQASIKNRYAFMIGSQAVRYRHEIRAFQPYEVHTDIIAQDNSWIWLRHTVHADSKMCGHVLVRVIVKQGRDTVPPSTILRLAGVDPSTVGTPDKSSEIMGFLEWDSDVAIQMKKHAAGK